MAGGAHYILLVRLYSAVDLRIEIPDDLVPLDVTDIDQVRLVIGQAHGKALGLKNIVGLEEIPVGLLRLVALAPDNVKTQRATSMQ